jgi:hypothetical protein
MGVFDDNPAFLNQWCLYGASIEWVGKVMGGVPMDARIIEGWLRTKMGISDREELRQAMLRTAYEVGLDVSENMSYEQLVELTSKVASARQTQGFKVAHDDGQLYLESRQVKAMLRESTNILFAGDRWGKTKKGPRAYLAERVFVFPSILKLGVTEPDGVDLSIGHLTGPGGPRATIGYTQFVMAPKIDCQVMVLEDAIDPDHWARIWGAGQFEGLGARRSAGHGVFEVTRWDRLGTPTAEQYKAIIAADKLLLRDQPIPDRNGTR